MAPRHSPPEKVLATRWGLRVRVRAAARHTPRAPTRAGVNETMSSAIIRVGHEAAAARAVRASAASSSSSGAMRNGTAAAARVAAKNARGRRGNAHVARVARPRGARSDQQEEAQYREMLRVTKEWMAYDPDELPENYPAPWETHVKNLMENGPWPCWDPEMDERLRGSARVHPVQGDARAVQQVR